MDFIHNNKIKYVLEAICTILPITPSTYYRHLDLTKNPDKRSKRALHDEHYAEEIKRIWRDSSGRYGIRKVWAQLKKEGYSIARCRIARLMQMLDIQGIWRGKNKQTTHSRDDQKHADDLVKRDFTAQHPNLAKQCFSGWLTSLIFRPIQAGYIRHLSLMCSHEQS